MRLVICHRRTPTPPDALGVADVEGGTLRLAGILYYHVTQLKVKLLGNSMHPRAKYLLLKLFLSSFPADLMSIFCSYPP